jgi:hypothetical protein
LRRSFISSAVPCFSFSCRHSLSLRTQPSHPVPK